MTRALVYSCILLCLCMLINGQRVCTDRIVNVSIAKHLPPLPGGLSILVTNVYAHGNLGDEMETTPMINALCHWNPRRLDVELHPWTHEVFKGTIPPFTFPVYPNPVHSRMFAGLNNVYYRKHVDYSSYDIIIQAPGPQPEFMRCPDGVMALIPFSITLGGSPMQLQQCVKLLVIREPVSFELAKQLPNPYSIPILMSSDLTHSLQLSKVLLETATEQIISHFPKDYVLVIGRADSPMRLRRTNDNTFNITVTCSTDTWEVPVDKLIFATTDPIDYNWFHHLSLVVPRHQLFFLQFIEYLFAAIRSAKLVITNRYHPAVACLRLKANCQIICHPREKSKINGIVAQHGTPLATLRERNDASLKALHQLLTDLALEKIKKSSNV